MERHPPLLVWLDQIDRFSDEGLSPSMLRRCLGHASGSRVVATVSAMAYETWCVEHRDLAEMFDEVTLDRLPTQRELDLAAGAYANVDFTEGIGAAFTATGSLVNRMRAGNPNCPFEPVGGDCPLARPLVETVFAWTSTGTTRGLPMPRPSSSTCYNNGRVSTVTSIQAMSRQPLSGQRPSRLNAPPSSIATASLGKMQRNCVQPLGAM